MVRTQSLTGASIQMSVHDGRLVTITGANGFVGRHLCDALAANDWRVRAVTRRGREVPASASEVVSTGDVSERQNWDEALANTGVVVHCAGLAHTHFKEQGNR